MWIRFLAICLTLITYGCMDDELIDPRPGPRVEPDAGLFDARPPLNAPNTGSGYSGEAYSGSGAIDQPDDNESESEFEQNEDDNEALDAGIHTELDTQ